MLGTGLLPFSASPYYATYPKDGVAENCEFTREEWDAPYQPTFEVLTIEVFKDPAVCKTVVDQFPTPGEMVWVKSLFDDQLTTKMSVLHCMTMSHGGEILARYRRLNQSHHEYVLSADSRLKGYEEKVASLTGLEHQVSTLKKQVFRLNDKLSSSDASFTKSKAKGKERKIKIKSLTKSLDNLHIEVARLSTALRSKQPFILEESPLDTMADQHIMAELLRVPTEGYVEAIMVPPILADHFELKHSLINMMTSNQFFGLEKDNPHDHIRWFNKITFIIKYKNVPNSAIKLMLFPSLLRGHPVVGSKKNPLVLFSLGKILFPKSSMNSFLPQERKISEMKFPTFNNGLMNRFIRRTQDVLTIIENKSKVRNLRNKSIVSQVKSIDANSSSSSEIAKLTHAVNQQTSAVTTAMTAILKQFQTTPPLASVKAVEEIFVTCGGAHSYYQCLASDGNTFLEFQDNIQGNISAAAVNYN
nr:hypothetical protein [Tanacetum cinerariifolium]